jgi:hypothetical protein
LAGEGVEGERAEEVAAHSALDLVEGTGGLFDPVEGEGLGETIDFGAEVGVAEEFRGAGLEEEDVFEEEGEGSEEGGGLLLAFGSGAVSLGHLEEGGVVRLGCGLAEEKEGVGAGGGVGFEVEAEGLAGGSLGEAGDEGALPGIYVGAAVGEEHLDLFHWQCSQAHCGTAGADGGEELAGVFGEDDDVDSVGWLLEDLEEGVGGLLHEVGRGEDEDLAARFAREGVRALDEGADLA